MLTSHVAGLTDLFPALSSPDSPTMKDSVSDDPRGTLTALIPGS